MPKSKIFFALATLVLGVTAFVTTNANSKRFAAFSTAVTAGGSVSVKSMSNIFTTIAANGTQFFLATALGGTQEWYYKLNRTKPAYLKN